jgi:hypothetical protein
MFMWPCMVNVFRYNQQDATLHSGICYYNCSTCFRRFIRPSSGAQNSSSSALTIAVRRSESSTNTRCCVYSFELLMMGGGTVWNMQSIYSNKSHCVTLHHVGCASIQNKFKILGILLSWEGTCKVSTARAVAMYGVQVHSFLTVALDIGESPISCPSLFVP